MHNQGKLKGITVNGIAIDTYLNKYKDEKVEKEVMAIVRASKCQNIYHRVRARHIKSKEERNGPVMKASNSEIHKENKGAYIRQTLHDKNIKGAIVGVLLSTPKEISAFEIKKEINTHSKSELIKNAQVRVHLGHIMKSELGQYIRKNFTDGRGRGAKYEMSEKGKEHFTLDSAIKAAKTQYNPEKSEGAVLDKSKPKNVNFVVADENKLPVLKVSGQIDINVHVHFHWGR